MRWSTRLGRYVGGAGIAVGADPSGANGALQIGIAGHRRSDSEGGAFVASVSADDGRLRWQRAIGGHKVEVATVDVGPSGQVVVTGTFVRLDLREGGQVLRSQSNWASDAFVATYDAGSLVWVETWGGLGKEDVSATALDAAGGVAIAFNTSADDPNHDIPDPDFGSGVRPIVGHLNPFVLHFDERGNYVSDAPIGDEYTKLRVRSIAALDDGWAIAGTIGNLTVDGAVVVEGDAGFVGRYDRQWAQRWYSALGTALHPFAFSDGEFVVGGASADEELRPGGFGVGVQFFAGLDPEHGKVRWQTILPKQQLPLALANAPQGGLLVETTSRVLHVDGGRVCWAQRFEPSGLAGFATLPTGEFAVLSNDAELQLLVPCRTR